MNKLSKEKRDKLILICIGFVGVLAVLYTFVLGSQKNSLSQIQTQITGAQSKLTKAEIALKSADTIESNLNESKKVIETRQEKMAPQGDYYNWFFKLVDQFRKDERLDTGFIVDLTMPESVEAGLLPKFPYKAASFGLRVNGQFHDIGRFIANLENNFPYFRVQNVRLAHAPPQAQAPVIPGLPQLPGTPEPPPVQNTKLVAELRIVTLIKPGAI
ncbi:MAG TPA: hypothetical protein VF773_15205 [Verrucomicrobiae bacterium]